MSNSHLGNDPSTVYYLIRLSHSLALKVKLYYKSSARKMTVAESIDFCLQVDIKSKCHVLSSKGSQRGWRQWLLELYGKEVYRLG